MADVYVFLTYIFVEAVKLFSLFSYNYIQRNMRFKKIM